MTTSNILVVSQDGLPGSSDRKESTRNGETRFDLMGWEDPKEKECRTHQQ